MKIDIVTDTFAPDVNGVAMTLGRLSDGLRERGHRVHVIRTGEGKRGETIAASVPLPGYKEVRVGLPGPFKLRKRWLKRRPDAIYVATESPLGRSAVKAAKALGIPVASGFHTNFHEYMERYSLSGLQPMAMAYLKRFHDKTDCTLAPSPELVEKLKAEGFHDVHLLGRGVDTKLFTPAKRSETLRASWGARAATPVAIVVGRIAAEKNLDLAMRAFGEMRATVPDLQCVMVGDGPVREKLAAKFPWVHFAGVQLGEDLAKHYASADILLFPSETETFGNVVLEGMASGLATVAYDYAAAARFVQHGLNGLKAEKGDAEGFIEQSKAALAIRPSHGMRLAARELAETQGWEAVVKSFEERLEEISGNAKLPARKITKLPKLGKRDKVSFRTVFISDIHLGSADSKATEVVDFLKQIQCEKLVLNGDIVDGWALKRGSKWLPRHSRVVRKILKMSEKDKTEVVYLRGNHDDILERFLPLAFGKIRFLKEHIHVSADKLRYLVVHGDGFDSVSTNHKWLATLGAVGYDTLLVINRHYNRWRAWCGKEYFSLSKRVKGRVKSAVSFIDKYEELLQELAVHKGCDGIICGHIHTPEDKQVGEIRYLNSGDWVESLTAIVEHHDGRMELISYEDFMAGCHARSMEKKVIADRFTSSGPVSLAQ
ncbi:MAG: glycosyltransferase [Akkermansiaceae bacterium]|jgi:UDP-2,3-diacylglucosamine pyrophosphatase LpxH/glycosyltransferase involved in cell wall biosynthesis|nr:glycosyltransferase [Akkermansiaceae bacterium]MDP4779356.1 glycosyltransferase [Akkermansiaceae bacterium]MDP4996406.1 glycosyltransferase [Akkermansiaceae bacterium]